jgi:sporulation protein YpjB
MPTGTISRFVTDKGFGFITTDEAEGDVFFHAGSRRKQTIEEGERDQFYNHLNRLAVYYELVRPSIAVSHPPRMYVQLDSQMAYFFNERAELWSDKEHTTEMLQSLHRQMRVAFFMENGDQLSFWLLLLGLGTFICTILAYVGWKKYTGEQKKETVSWRELNRK